MQNASEAHDLSSQPSAVPVAQPPLLTVLPPPEPDPEQAQILAELEKLQNPRQTWASGLVLFGVSLVLFASLGAWRWEASFVLMLLVVLFLHELGHYVAMESFKYRNLKMFFIPLFGAVVCGVQLRAAGWKKAVVSLMGPLPGIGIGVVLTLLAITTDSLSLGTLALTFLLINGFNLLPVLPLDGGWMLNAVLFCRNKWVEAGFKVAASLGLFALTLALHDRLFVFLGIWMLLSVQHTFRISTIAERLTAKACPLDTEEDRQISRGNALAIIGEIKATLPPKPVFKPKTLAQIVMSVYEKRHTAPPGFWASVGLLAAYFGTIFVTLLFTSILLVHRCELKARQDPEFRKQYQAMVAKQPPPPPAEAH